MKSALDFKSLKFKIWLYFAIFAVVLMAILWFLQIIFLETYYEDMKTKEIIRAANSIAGEYGQLDIEKMKEYSYKDDMYIHLESDSGIVIYTASSAYVRPSIISGQRDIEVVKRLLKSSRSGTVSFTINDRPGNVKTLVYGKLIRDNEGNNIYLSIFAPLSPVESTVEILANQLIIITVISLILAFSLSFFISRNLTKPLVKITDSASLLARGNYGVKFEGGQYSEIIRLADTLNYTSKELAKSDELKKDLIANVSHDLRTPLTMVKSYAEMIRDLSGDNPEKRNSHLQVIIDEADRLNQLVSDLLTLSKMQSGVSLLEIQEFNLAEAARSVLSSYQILKETGEYSFICSFDDIVTVKGDPGRIKQVLSNLLNNAVRYDNRGKEITLSITDCKDRVRCEVKDRGEGIPDEELEHIWERYYKVSGNRGRSSGGGSGLGLAIVKEILTLHGARFGVESKVGSGSNFWFELFK